MQRKPGPLFDDSDDEDETDSHRRLLEKFENVDRVLENAALTASLLNYIFNKSLDYYSLLYYYTIQKYLRLNATQNSLRNYNHINMEIYTVFIHPNSILKIPVNSPELIASIEGNINSQDCVVYFHKISKCIVAEVINSHLTQFRQAIKCGLETFSYTNKIHEDINRMKELTILDNVHKSIQNSFIRSQKSRCLPSPKQEVKNQQLLYDFRICAVITAINTQYEYFLFRKKYSYTTKHPDIVIPIITFLSCSPIRLINKQRIKGHCFEEDSLLEVSFCIVCDLILWGTHPQCLYCRNCQKAIHRDCKDTVKYCQIDTKRNKKGEHTDSETDKEAQVLGRMNIDLSKIIDECSMSKDQKTPYFSEDELQSPKSGKKPNLPVKPSIAKLQELIMQSPSLFSSDKTRNTNVKHTKSVNSNTNIKRADVDIVTRSKSARSPSPERFFNKELNRFQTRSTSEDSGLAASVEPLPISQMDADEEMQVLETFEPEIELKRFPKSFNKLEYKHKADNQRLLVLMEFHHNTRFTRMTLKRFKYLLVDPWLRMNEHLELFDFLSLNCIDKLYKLIGSLVDVMDSCETESTYDSDIAERILSWLSADDDKNLQFWLQLSTDLCCTNILQSVKANWMEYKQLYPKLNELFSIEINRIVIFDKLSNMRPLLFNLPMIGKKIIKDLQKFWQFKDEAKIWEQIHDKLSLLPQLIDERCMPVVQMINNGTILKSSLKYKRNKCTPEMKSYINNFPNTIFKNRFIDFQFVKILNLRQSCAGDCKTMQPIYVREEADAAAICYDKEMILLQKDNEKYILKRFKSPTNSKLFPVIEFDDVHVTKQTYNGNEHFPHKLTVLVINQAILAQILFRDEKTRDMWFCHITNITINMKEQVYVTDQEPSSSTLSGLSTDNYEFNTIEDQRNLSNSNYKNTQATEIRSRLNQSVNNFLSTLDFISNKLSTGEPSDEILKASTESESSDESTLDCDDIDDSNQQRSENIKNYIEDIISEALSKIQNNSKPGNGDK